LFDASLSRAVDRHAGSKALDTLDGAGKWLPVVALGGAGLALQRVRAGSAPAGALLNIAPKKTTITPTQHIPSVPKPPKIMFKIAKTKTTTGRSGFMFESPPNR